MPRKGENIYKRKDGRWEGRYMKGRALDGRAIYGYIYASSYKTAKANLAEAVSTLHVTPVNKMEPGESVLFQDLAETWFAYVKPQIKESTNIKYHNLWDTYIAPKLGKLYVNELTHSLLEMFCNELMVSGGAKGTGLSPKTATDVLSLIRNMLRFSANRGIIPPSDGCSVSIKQPAKEMRVLSRQEQHKLCDYLNQNLNVKNIGILVCLYTGIRIGEVCALRWEDISLTEKTIYIHQTMQRLQIDSPGENKTKITVTPPKSKCSFRMIPLPDDLALLLSHYPVQKHGYFLTGSIVNFVEPRSMQSHFKRVLKSCGIKDANYHSLRHSFATRCVELGFDVKSLSELLGHASVSITMNRYVHPSMELKRNNMQKLSIPFTVK